jgi:hypothetical protein
MVDGLHLPKHRREVMIDINLDKSGPTIGGYGFSISGNSEENELLIMVSPTQASSAPVLIVAMSVDGGCKVLVSATGLRGYSWVDDDDMGALFSTTIRDWARGGIKPNDQEDIEIEKKVKAACEKLLEHFAFIY